MAEEKSLKRVYYCGNIDDKFINKNITVYGWVNKKRQLGGITFLDLRDRSGILQIVIEESFTRAELVKSIGNEYVLSVSGKIKKRLNPNPEMKTGSIELIAEKIIILSVSDIPPFYPEKNSDVSEELRFKYRYIDLRNLKLQHNFSRRSEVSLKIRNYLSSLGFLDIETPMLTKATPEGARDYLVPSRVYKGRMFALPQSPQLFKQLLMVSGFERYYQIVKCFRDEDLRADRQPEFTQVDIEMSFTGREELFQIVEGIMQQVFDLSGQTIKEGFKIMPYQEAMEKYGTDAPDLRIPCQIKDFTQAVKPFNSVIFNSIIENKGKIKGLVFPRAQKYSRKVLEEINNFIRELGGKGAVWIKKAENGFKASIKVAPDILENFYSSNNINKEDIVFLLGGQEEDVLFLAGKLRVYLGRDTMDTKGLNFVWITDFPLFFYNEEEKRFESNHHPFTSPYLDQLDLLAKDPAKVISISYDLVLNGVEIGGGSQRINNIDLQKQVFQLLNLAEEEVEQKFGFFLNALKYGAPPHLGIALGLDRIIMLLTGEESIRETISFPKTTSSLCLLTGSPSEVSQKQLDELGINFKK